MSFLGIGSKKQKRAAQAAQTTINHLISSGQQLDDQSIQTLVFASDGKITAKEKKLIKTTTKQTNKTDRVEIRKQAKVDKVVARQDGRTDRVTSRQDGRTDRVAVRQEGRSHRSDARQATRATAYENGIDPMAWTKNIADGLGNIAQGVVGVASANAAGRLFQSGSGADRSAQSSGVAGMFGPIGAAGSAAQEAVRLAAPTPDPKDPKDDQQSMLFMVALAIAAIFIITKKKR